MRAEQVFSSETLLFFCFLSSLYWPVFTRVSVSVNCPFAVLDIFQSWLLLLFPLYSVCITPLHLCLIGIVSAAEGREHQQPRVERGGITSILLFVLLFLPTLTWKICSHLKPVHSSGSTLIFKPFFASCRWLLVSRWLQSLLIVSLQGWNEMEVISTFQLGFHMSTFQNSQYWGFCLHF